MTVGARNKVDHVELAAAACGVAPIDDPVNSVCDGAHLVIRSDGGVGHSREERCRAALAGDAHQSLPLAHPVNFLRPPGCNLP